MNWPSAANSSSCAALAAKAGPVVPPREKTKTCPLELTATPVTSPRWMSLGNLIGSGTESKGMTGTDCWAYVHALNNSKDAISQRFFMIPPLEKRTRVAAEHRLAQQRYRRRAI